jgi:hypothetical protein
MVYLTVWSQHRGQATYFTGWVVQLENGLPAWTNGYVTIGAEVMSTLL